MKTMTCAEMGGPCNASFQGKGADEIIKAQDRHLREMVAGGDELHQSARQAMQNRWKHPVAGMGWYIQMKKAYRARPED